MRTSIFANHNSDDVAITATPYPTEVTDPFVTLQVGSLELFLSPEQGREIISSLEIALRELAGDMPEATETVSCSSGRASLIPPWQLGEEIYKIRAGAYDEDATPEECDAAAARYLSQFQQAVEREAPCAYYVGGNVYTCAAHAEHLDLDAIYETVREETQFLA